MITAMQVLRFTFFFVCIGIALATVDQEVPVKFLGLDYKGHPVYMPLIGAGTWQYDEDEAYESVCKAFAAGYTFVDTAYGYKNQKGVGRAIKDCWKGNRTDLFVMTKIPGECR